MLAVNNNRGDVSWVTSYPPYVTIEAPTPAPLTVHLKTQPTAVMPSLNINK